MTRIDIPTLECDRCQTRTQNKAEMSAWLSITINTIESKRYDLCSSCDGDFYSFMRGAKVSIETVGKSDQ